MSQKIDCFLIGHNQMAFEEYETSLKQMGVHSGAYRDLDKNFIQYNNKLYSAADLFNSFYSDNNTTGSSVEPIKGVETFSAGIAYLGTYLHRHGFSWDYVNSFREEKQYLLEKLQQENILAIALLTTLYVTPLPILEILNFIRTYNHTAKIIIGGPFVSTKFRTCNAEELDYLFKSLNADFYVNSSQGESTLVKILGSLKNDLPLNKINNTYYKTDQGYVSTPILREDNKISENMVNWDLFADRVGEFVNVRTVISCPFSCAFCGFPQHAGKYQTASVEAVEEELNRLAKIKSVKGVTFVDDTFNVPEKRFKELLNMMVKNNYSFKWSSFFRCQYADRETVELMKESGCENVLLGLESGNEQILKNMNKSAAVAKYLEGISLLKEYGIKSMGNFVIGFPGETEDTIQDTLEFIQKSHLDFYRAQLWYYEHITPIARQKDKYDLKGESFEWSHKTMNSQQACDLLDKLILSCQEPVRYLQYYFDYDIVFQLPLKGIPPEQVKKYLKSFDNGVKEKLRNPSRKEVSHEVIKQMKESCRPIDGYIDPFDLPVSEIDTGEGEYDF
ncbi:MAG: PhpK family radical SAM P-methyltransferase [Candidatus Aminicenantes bacterium]|jgi:radical SAM PhpK family P-methyltransferase